MATSTVFLQDLAVVATIAALASLLFQRLKLPLVFGLLAAGVVIGPHTPPFSFVQDEENLRTLADFGVVLILFGLGLDFNLRSIRRVGLGAVAVTVVEVLLMLWVGYEIGILMGWSQIDAIFLGAMLGVSSTAIIVSVLRELGRLDSESTRLVFAVLVLEDLAAILILVLVGGYSATGALPVDETLLVLGRMALFLVGGLAVGLVLVPRILDAVATRYRPEVTVLAIMGLALGGGVLSHLAGFHVGLGAFLVGAVASEARRKAVLEERFRPVHDLFGAIFFVSIGTLVDFSVLAEYWRPLAIITIVIVVGKFVSGGLASFLAGFAPRTSVEVGASLAQIGEFSFVIAAVGLASGRMSEFLFPLIVAAAAITSFLSPLLIRAGPKIARDLGNAMPSSAKTYAAVYTNWMRGLHGVETKPSTAAIVARRRALLSGVLLIVVLGAGAAGQAAATDWLDAEFGPQGAGLVYWGAILAVAVPLAVELAREVRRWTDAAPLLRGSERDQALGVRVVVRYTIYVLVLIMLGLPVLAATAPFIEGPAVLVAWLAIVGFATLLLGRGIVRLHRRVHDNVEALLREETSNLPVPEVVQAVVAKGLTGPLGTDATRIGANSWAAGRTVAETRLRTSTGASLLMINRADRHLPAAPTTALLPGDEVVLLGSREQLDAARALLARPAETGLTRPVQPGQLFVPDGSPHAGQTLAETQLRLRHGVQVVAVQRGTDVVPNPGPAEVIRAGDVLVALGTDQALLRAQQELRGEAAKA